MRPMTPTALLLACLLTAPGLHAEPGDASAMQSELGARVGQSVTLKLSSGDELTGIVRRATGELVHLGELSGREFFDAVIATREIAAVIFRRK